MKKILFTACTFSDDQVRFLKSKGFEVISQKGDMTEDELIMALKNIDAYILGGDEIATDKVINSTDKLKIISFFGTGYDRYIDVEAANKKGIVVTNTPKANSRTVAEFTIGLILNSLKQIITLNKDTKEGKWTKHKSWNLEGKTVGIIGMGAVGSIVTKILYSGFGMKIIYFSRTAKPEIERLTKAVKVDLPILLKQSDIVTLHITYSKETVDLIGEKEISLMKPSSIIINTSSAKIINGQAIYRALKNNKIASAAFDVYYQEPAPSPDRDEYQLLSLPDSKFVLTPHNAYNSSDAVRAMETMVIESILDYFEGKEVRHRVPAV